MHIRARLAGFAGVEPRLHGVRGNGRAFLLWEAEHAGGNAAERDGLRAIKGGGVKATQVALRQLFALFNGGRALRHGADGVDDALGGQVVAGRDLRAADGLFVTLLLHDLRALQAQLHAGERVDGVIDAQVAGNPATQKRAVRGVDDDIATQRRDVAAPQGQALVGGNARQLVGLGDARLGHHQLQNAVLHLQKRRRGGLRLARVHQRAELLPLLHEPTRVLLRLNVLRAGAAFIHQVVHQVRDVFN